MTKAINASATAASVRHGNLVLSGATRAGPISAALGIINHPPVHNRHCDLHLVEMGGVHLENIAVEDYHVGNLSGRETAFCFFLNLRVSGTDGIGADRFVQRDLLLRHP